MDHKIQIKYHIQTNETLIDFKSTYTCKI